MVLGGQYRLPSLKRCGAPHRVSGSASMTCAHLFAVEMLRGGASIYRVSQHLGHTSVKTTEIYLAHLTPEEVERSRQ
jgi:site-specific recombinase XerD